MLKLNLCLSLRLLDGVRLTELPTSLYLERHMQHLNVLII